MTKYLLAAALLTTTALSAQEGPTTQALVAFDSKATVKPTPQNVTLKVDNRQTPLTSLTAVPPTGVQVALLIDDGLRSSVGRELSNLKAFVNNLPSGVEILIGYMQNGHVAPATPGFTTNHAAAATTIRIPLGSPGLSASPYFCLSDIIKSWPGAVETEDMGASSPSRKARIVLMITNGVDPYNGSTNITNQNSPYVDTAVRDAQRAGIPVYSIYFTDAGFGGQSASFSGQSYLQQVADGSGGVAYYQGTGNPVSMAPFLKQFQRALAETYIATFTSPDSKDLVRIKLSTSLPSTKVHAPDQVRPGTRFTP
jgi:hypothetical protein